jgi:cardiolipin synthase
VKAIPPSRASSAVLNIPNIITMARLLLVPALLYFLAQSGYLSALLVFLSAGLSDALDGYLARRLNQFTQFGAILDPVADKLMLVSALVMLTWLGFVPWQFTATLLTRDLVIIAGAFAYRMRAGKLEMTPTWLGKTHIALMFALLVLVMGDAAGVVSIAAALPALFGLTLASGIASGAHYVWVWGRKAMGLRRR